MCSSNDAQMIFAAKRAIYRGKHSSFEWNPMPMCTNMGRASTGTALDVGANDGRYEMKHLQCRPKRGRSGATRGRSGDDRRSC